MEDKKFIPALLFGVNMISRAIFPLEVVDFPVTVELLAVTVMFAGAVVRAEAPVFVVAVEDVSDCATALWSTTQKLTTK